MVRKHSLCEKNAVIAMILTVPLGLLTQLSGQPQGVVSALIVSALSLVLLIIYNKWFSPEFDGVFKARVPVKEILMVSSAMAILIIGCIIINAIYSGLAFKPSVSFVCLALMASQPQNPYSSALWSIFFKPAIMLFAGPSCGCCAYEHLRCYAQISIGIIKQDQIFKNPVLPLYSNSTKFNVMSFYTISIAA